MYRKDCLRLFRRVIDHSLVFNSEIEQYFKEQAFIDTCRLYEQTCGEKYSQIPSTETKNTMDFNDAQAKYSYWDRTGYEFSPNAPEDYENPFSFVEADILLDLEWLDQCKTFMSNSIDKVRADGYGISKSEGIDLTNQSLKRLKKSYERFLYMAAKYPLRNGNSFIPPTCAIDIIWHAHMQEPLKYEADCLRLVGDIVYHDPWPVVEDKEMKQSCNKVDQIWKDEFQCEMETDHLYNTSEKRTLLTEDSD